MAKQSPKKIFIEAEQFDFDFNATSLEEARRNQIERDSKDRTRYQKRYGVIIETPVKVLLKGETAPRIGKINPLLGRRTDLPKAKTQLCLCGKIFRPRDILAIEAI